jgi:ATP-dependent Clp protease ATP-binding subunit ClpC
MFERFTDRARRVVVLAQEESRLLRHDYIGTEHLLLGLVKAGEGAGATALTELGVSPSAVRHQVESMVGPGEQAPGGHVPFTPRAKKVVELSLREAQQLGDGFIGTEHLLLGMLREGEGVAAQILMKLGVDLERTRETVVRARDEQGSGSSGRLRSKFVEAGIGGLAVVRAAVGTDPPRCPHCGSSIDEQLRTSRLPATDETGAPSTVRVVWCGVCGINLGVVGVDDG